MVIKLRKIYSQSLNSNGFDYNDEKLTWSIGSIMFEDEVESIYSLNSIEFEPQAQFNLIALIILDLTKRNRNEITIEEKLKAEISNLLQIINTGTFDDWLTIGLSNIKDNIGGYGYEHSMIEKIAASLIEVIRLSCEIGSIYEMLDAFTRQEVFSQGSPRTAAIRGVADKFDFDKFQAVRTIWYETELMIDLILSLPSSVNNLLLTNNRLQEKSKEELLDILNAVPEPITYVSITGNNFSKTPLDDLQFVFKNLDWQDKVLKMDRSQFPDAPYAMEFLLCALPPRVRIKMKHMRREDYTLQIKARRILHAALQLVENPYVKFDDNILRIALKDLVFWSYIFTLEVNGCKEEIYACVIAYLSIFTLMEQIADRVRAGDFFFWDMVVLVSEEKDECSILHKQTYFNKIMELLEASNNPVAYLCSALLLTKQINCFYDKDKSPQDELEYFIKRTADAATFLYKATQDPLLTPISRHFLAQIKHMLKSMQNTSPSMRSLSRYISAICNKLEPAPSFFMVWGFDSFDNSIAMEEIVMDPPKVPRYLCG